MGGLGAIGALKKASLVVQVADCAFNHPAVAPQPGPVLSPPAGDLVGDPPGPQETSVFVVVIATVGDESLGAMAGPPGWAVYLWDRIHQRDELGDVVAIGRGRREGQQEPPGVG